MRVLPCQRLGLVDAVQYQICQGDGEHQVLLFPTKKSVVLEGIDVGAGGTAAQLAGDVFISEARKPPVPQPGS